MALPPSGRTGPSLRGLNPTGAVNGNCRASRTWTTRRPTPAPSATTCWCAIVYASYFEKDQACRHQSRRSSSRL
ncbi:NPP1 family protein [Streptosporangium vulgare]|uniref:NPP1 family protein n=1 Tax=Streptosporangium vulgare TaxID=46190 RepID=UPI003CD0AAE4